MPATAVLVVEVDSMPVEVGDSWRQGPLPVPLPRAMFPKFLYSDVADQATREEFLERRVHGLLYGSAQDPVRRHRWDSGEGRGRPGGWTITALELLAYPSAGPAGGLMAIHLRLDDPLETVAGAVAALANIRPISPGESLGDTTRPHVEALIGQVLPGAAMRNRRIGYVVSHVAFPDGPPGGLVPGSDAEPALQWSRVMALANEPGALPGELRGPERRACDLDLSATWETCVLKNGAAFVGRTGTRSEAYHHAAKAFVHSVYLDALLLGLVQRDCVDELSNSIDALWQGGPLAVRSGFEKRMIRFRSEAWWTDVSETANVNRILQAFQDAYDLTERQDRLHADIRDVSAVLAGERADRTNLLLNMLLVMSIGFGVASLIADPGLVAVAWGVGLGLAAAFALMLFERWGSRAERR